jgi:hypothetical protein
MEDQITFTPICTETPGSEIAISPEEFFVRLNLFRLTREMTIHEISNIPEGIYS